VRVRVVPKSSTEAIIERNALQVADAEKDALMTLGKAAANRNKQQQQHP